MLRRLALVSTLLVAGSAVGSTVFAGSAIAGTAIATFNLTASVAPNCTISTADMDFGAYVNAAATVNGSVTTVCNLATGNVTIDLNNGTHAGIGTQRKLSTAGTNTLNYDLYSDSGFITTWGSGTGKNVSVSGTSSVTSPIYGKILGQGVKPAGNYSDTVTATVNF